MYKKQVDKNIPRNKHIDLDKQSNKPVQQNNTLLHYI